MITHTEEFEQSKQFRKSYSFSLMHLPLLGGPANKGRGMLHCVSAAQK
jgi:hypothetical protein